MDEWLGGGDTEGFAGASTGMVKDRQGDLLGRLDWWSEFILGVVG